MAWLLIIISVVLVWVASLCKTRQASFSPSKTVFLNNGGKNPYKIFLIVGFYCLF